MSRRPLQVALGVICVAGFVAAAGSVAATGSGARDHITELLLLSAVSALLSLWSQQLPSGVTVNPGVVLSISGIVLLPPVLVIIPVLPALAAVAFRERQPWWRYSLTLGLAALSLYPSAVLYQALAPVGKHRLGAMSQA